MLPGRDEPSKWRGRTLVVYGLLNNQIATELGVTNSTVRAAHRLGHATRQASSLTDVGEIACGTELGPFEARSCYYASDRHHGLIDRGRLHPYGSPQDRVERSYR
jgi:hypothetical protein